jgi:hypothetical protein
MFHPALRTFVPQSRDLRSLKGRTENGLVADTALNLVVRSQRLRVANQFLPKLPFEEPLAIQPAGGGPREGNNDMSVESPEWFVAERLRQKMLAIETLCPDVNDDKLDRATVREGSVREFNLAREILKIGFADHYQLSSKIGINRR